MTPAGGPYSAESVSKVARSLAQQEEYRVRDRDGDREPQTEALPGGWELRSQERSDGTWWWDLLLRDPAGNVRWIATSRPAGEGNGYGRRIVAALNAEAALLARPVEPDPDDDELERLARAATPGPWYQSGLPWFQDRLVVLARSEDPHVGAMVADTSDIHGDEERTNAEADAAFIAAANPATVLALLARRAPGDRDALREALADMIAHDAEQADNCGDWGTDPCEYREQAVLALAADSRPEQPAPLDVEEGER